LPSRLRIAFPALAPAENLFVIRKEAAKTFPASLGKFRSKAVRRLQANDRAGFNPKVSPARIYLIDFFFRLHKLS
jgi:hypothetical protein